MNFKKKFSILHFDNIKLIYRLVYFTDILSYLNEFNVSFQEKEGTIIKM